MPDGERKNPIIPPTDMTPEEIAKALLRPTKGNGKPKPLPA